MNRLLIAGSIVFSVFLTSLRSQAQTWTPLSNTPNISAYNPLLLTDGTVMVQDGDGSDWWKLTPDNKGSYASGTWSQLASTPGYGPLYYASAVLPDGRVFTMGGEYNFGNAVWQTQGFIYDPVRNTWTSVNCPSAWNSGMGDTGSCMLPSGVLLVADPLSDQCAIFDPTSNTFGTPFVNGKADGNDEEGLCLMPNGTVLTVDAVNTPNSEIFDPKTVRWSPAGSTINNLVQATTEEIGPMVLRPDGTIIAFGGSAHNSIYNTKTGIWSAGPDFPTVTAGQLDCADAPACLLPSGNVICETSPGFAMSGVVFFEWNGKTLTQVAATPSAAGDTSFTGNFLMLPTGQVLYTNQSPAMYFYTSAGTFQTSWAPAITAYPTTVGIGASYTISGTQFNGLSGSSAYGDDEQNETNYAQIRITNNKTGHVFYCPAFSPSSYLVQTGSTVVSTNFTVPKGIEQGASTIQVVCNGDASVPQPILVGPPVSGSAVSVYQGTYVSGNLASVQAIDGNSYKARSVGTSAGQTVSVEVDFILGSSNVSQISVTGTGFAIKGATGQLFLYDNKAAAWVFIGPATAMTSASSTLTAASSGSAARFVGPGNKVRAIMRTLVPQRLVTTGSYIMGVDCLQISA